MLLVTFFTFFSYSYSFLKNQPFFFNRIMHEIFLLAQWMKWVPRDPCNKDKAYHVTILIPLKYTATSQTGYPEAKIISDQNLTLPLAL